MLRAAVGRAAGAASDNAVATGYVTAWRAVRRLPEPAALRLFEALADQLYRRGGRGVRRLRANLAVVAPTADLDALTREAVRSYLRYWCEAFRLPSWPTDDLVGRVRITGEHHLRTAFAEGPGAVVALPHTANWDWAGAWACATGMPVVAVAERLRPERLYDEFVAFRASIGMEIVPLSGGEPPLAALERSLARGRLVCLLADRDLGRSGVEVTLCGRPARVPRGPAVLARRAGVGLVPATFHYAGPEIMLCFHEPVAHRPGEDGVRSMMQEVADVFTAGITAHPQDWHMMQKVFG